MTYAVPDTEIVTDHDPTGVLWVSAQTSAVPLAELGSCAFDEAQTHRSIVTFYESGVDDLNDTDVATRPTRADAIAMLDPSCPADAEDWRAYALVPAQVDGELVIRGDAWGDLLCALALAAGRPGSNPTNPLHCDHDRLTLNVDPADFTWAEHAQLDEWGFSPHPEGGFISFRFGSA
jgi:hypothetical protein